MQRLVVLGKVVFYGPEIMHELYTNMYHTYTHITHISHIHIQYTHTYMSYTHVCIYCMHTHIYACAYVRIHTYIYLHKLTMRIINTLILLR